MQDDWTRFTVGHERRAEKDLAPVVLRLWEAVEHQLSAQRIAARNIEPEPGRRKRGMRSAQARKQDKRPLAPGGRPTEVVDMTIWEHGKYVGERPVERVIDTVTHMLNSGHIDKRQFQAAQTYRNFWEDLHSGMPCTLDPSRSGGGQGGGSPTPRQQRGADGLAQANAILGMHDGRLVWLVVGEGLNIREAAAAFRPDPGRGDVEYTGKRFRDALTALAARWVYERRSAKSSGTGASVRYDPDLAGSEWDSPARGNVHVGDDVVPKRRRATKSA